MLARARKAGWIVLAALVTLLAAGRAEAQTQACMTDTDCPNAACGGEVCIRSSGLAFCYPANTQGASGVSDGWCGDAEGNAADANCKCRGMGATCNGFYCTFTIPPDGGAGGSTGTGGSGAGGAGSGSDSGWCSVGGAPGLGGVAGLGLLLAALVMGRARRRG